jgi:hypothetical protein
MVYKDGDADWEHTMMYEDGDWMLLRCRGVSTLAELHLPCILEDWSKNDRQMHMFVLQDVHHWHARG